MPNKQPDDLLEPDALKDARPVLRGEGSSDALPPTRLSCCIPPRQPVAATRSAAWREARDARRRVLAKVRARRRLMMKRRKTTPYR